MRQVVPSKTQMKRYLSKKLTQQQIADAWEEETGVKVSRSAIAMAIARYELKSPKPRPRYDEVLPWRVHQEHQNNINARMLRLEGRRLEGRKLTEKEQRWLNNWKANLQEAGAVVTYLPDDPAFPEGFVWMKRLPGDGDSLVRVSLRLPRKPRVPAQKKASA